MGFIMLMNPSALDGAPHSFIATVYADSAATEETILRDVTDRYPNVTAINVRDALLRVTDLLASLASATSWGASVTLLTGFLVLIGAAAADARARSHEAAILKVLGATRARILGAGGRLGGQPLRDGHVLRGDLALGARHHRGRDGHYPAGRSWQRAWPACRAACRRAARPRLSPGFIFAEIPASRPVRPKRRVEIIASGWHSSS
jgi:putative ABC transport system permease protein